MEESMNLRQKYKKAKQKLEMYEQQYKTQPIKYEIQQYPVIHLRAVRKMDCRYRTVPFGAFDYERRDIVKMLAKHAAQFVTFSERFDYIEGCCVIEGNLHVVDRRY